VVAPATEGWRLGSCSGDMKSGLRTNSCPSTESATSGYSTQGGQSNEGDQAPALDAYIVRMIPARFARCQPSGSLPTSSSNQISTGKRSAL